MKCGGSRGKEKNAREKRIYVHTFIYAFPSHSLAQLAHAYRHSIGLVICSLLYNNKASAVSAEPDAVLLLYSVPNGIQHIIYVYIIGLNLY